MSAESAVRAVLATQTAAWNRRDLEGFMATYWNDPGLTFYSGGTVTKGWRETRERYRQRYVADGKEMGTLAFDIHEVTALAPDAAAVKAAFTLQLRTGPQRGLFTLLLRNVGGAWKIVHDHTSAAG